MNNRPHLIPCLIAAAMLIAAVGKWPYGYYMLVKVVTCGAAVYVAYFSYVNDVVWGAWIYGILAIVFNPIVKFRLGRDGWEVMDVVAAILMIVAVIGIRRKRTEGNETKG